MSAIAAGIGAVGGLLQGRSQAKQAKEMSRLQPQQAKNAQALYNQASPYYGTILQYLARRAGLGGGPMAGGLGGALQQFAGRQALPGPFGRMPMGDGNGVRAGFGLKVTR